MMIPASASTINKKRKCLSLETKLGIIEEVERGNKAKADICQDKIIVWSQVLVKETCGDTKNDSHGLRRSEDPSKREYKDIF